MDPTGRAVSLFGRPLSAFIRKIQPALSKGQWVISDRFWDATGSLPGLGQRLKWENSWKAYDPLFWVPFGRTKPFCWTYRYPSAWPGPGSGSMARKNQKRNPASKKEATAFHEKIRHGYLSLARKEPQRIKVINATLPPNEIQQQIGEVLFD